MNIHTPFVPEVVTSTGWLLQLLLVMAMAIFSAAALCGSPVAAPSDSQLLQLMHGKQDNGRTIRLQKIVVCTPERTFLLWSTSDGVRSFFAPSSRIGRGVGDEYRILCRPADDPEGFAHGTKGARILATSPGRFLAFEWITFAEDASLGPNGPPVAAPEILNESPLPTWVEIEFLPGTGGTTLVDFRHYGFRDGELWSASQKWFTRAWQGVLEGLDRACQKERKVAHAPL